MSIPARVKIGEPMKASWANDVVGEIANSNRFIQWRQIGRNADLNPFDPLALYKEEDSWIVKVLEGYYYKPGQSIPTDITYGGTPLSAYPEITVEANKDLYFNYKTKALIWGDPENKANVKILKFTWDGDSFKITNMHPANIDLRHVAPFTPLICHDGTSTYSIGLTQGVVCERVPSQSGGALVNHVPNGLKDGTDPKYYDVENGKQISIIVNVTNMGGISGVPNVTVEDINPDSSHYWSPCADDQTGSTGIYHYTMIKMESDAFEKVHCGSIVDHFQDIPYIDNTFNPPAAGQARSIKDYNPANDKFSVRLVEQRPTTDPIPAQVKILEQTDTILVTGNSLSGSVVVTVNNEPAGYPITWMDGLVTSSGDTVWDVTIPNLSGGTGDIDMTIGDGSPTDVIDWTNGLTQTNGNIVIPIPTVVAGDNINVSVADNVYTVSCTLSGGSTATWPPSGWSEVSLYVCLSGTPQERIFLMKDL